MSNFVSCRHSVYGCDEQAFTLLPQVGIRHLEIGIPDGNDFGPVKAVVDRYGMVIATAATSLGLESEEKVQAFLPVIDAVARIGTKKIFVSVGGSDKVDRKELISRLRGVAEKSKEAGVVLCMETHPPFGTNGDEAKRTIEEVASAGLRFNFDTANIYYYNQGTDSVTELKKVASYVSSVHLKDTDGGYHSSNFPVLGQGVVEYPKVFEILGELGFEGPYTLELEGPLTDKKSIDEIHQSVSGCMQYLKSIKAV